MATDRSQSWLVIQVLQQRMILPQFGLSCTMNLAVDEAINTLMDTEILPQMFHELFFHPNAPSPLVEFLLSLTQDNRHCLPLKILDERLGPEWSREKLIDAQLRSEHGSGASCFNTCPRWVVPEWIPVSAADSDIAAAIRLPATLTGVILGDGPGLMEQRWSAVRNSLRTARHMVFRHRDDTDDGILLDFSQNFVTCRQAFRDRRVLWQLPRTDDNEDWALTVTIGDESLQLVSDTGAT